MEARRSLLVLDRDGVLNRLVPNPAEPRPDSPMGVSQVVVFPWVPKALRQLTEAGYGIVVASNQPAWAKGKTSREDLEAAHATVLREVQSEGGSSSALTSATTGPRTAASVASRPPGSWRKPSSIIRDTSSRGRG